MHKIKVILHKIQIHIIKTFALVRNWIMRKEHRLNFVLIIRLMPTILTMQTFAPLKTWNLKYQHFKQTWWILPLAAKTCNPNTRATFKFKPYMTVLRAYNVFLDSKTFVSKFWIYKGIFAYQITSFNRKCVLCYGEKVNCTKIQV